MWFFVALGVLGFARPGLSLSSSAGAVLWRRCVFAFLRVARLLAFCVVFGRLVVGGVLLLLLRVPFLPVPWFLASACVGSRGFLALWLCLGVVVGLLFRGFLRLLFVGRPVLLAFAVFAAESPRRRFFFVLFGINHASSAGGAVSAPLRRGACATHCAFFSPAFA